MTCTNFEFPPHFRPGPLITEAFRSAVLPYRPDGNGNGNGLGTRSVPRPGKSSNPRETGDVARYQFWPEAIAMGSLLGRKFTQMLGAGCEKGTDPVTKHGRSFLAFDFQRELLVIKADMKLPQAHLPPALRPLDAELSFDDITSHGIHIHQGRGFRLPSSGREGASELVYDVTVTISCRRPPKFYTKFECRNEFFESSGRFVPYRRRATAMDFAASNISERDAGPSDVIPEGPCAYPTYWNTYRWSFRMSEGHVKKMYDCASKIRLLAESDPDMDLMSKEPNAHWTVEKFSGEQYGREYRRPDLSALRFSARALVEGLIAHGILRPADTGKLLDAVGKNIVPVFQDRILESLYSFETIRNPVKVVQNRASFLRQNPSPKFSHLVLIRTVMVTPTRVLVSPPQQEPSNSVTRRYHDKLDAIIRVQFIDEEDRLFVADYMKQADNMNREVGLMARVRRALQYGLVIGGELFLPVASSASQQKEHAIWFINSKKIDGLELRRWMGNVQEKIVAKHAARMGLPFSTSRIVDLQITMGKQLADVERGGYTFTDGVAAAGREVLNQAAKALGEKHGLNASPSAIQGAKGVLADWPHLVQPYEVRLRPSLVKFESALEDLNVVRIAKYQVAFLNRQFINIMCANGVPTDLMVELFSDAVKTIKGLRGRVQAGRTTKEDDVLIRQCSDFPLSQLVKAGFGGNPLILDIADIIECRALQDLKWRARIKLPGGVFLIGIADETGLLKENEVFCQFQEADNVEPSIVLGEVLVCRAPALHPGDVRRALAVDCSQLRHLKNVIVFNVQGPRDLPNMLGGGDLDGDDYTLIWDQRFVRPLKMYEPMDYTAPKPITVEGKVTQSHLNENFVQYILNDVLGQVDNCHLALSDKLDEGPFAPVCLHLSEIHSRAVDFAKTGHAATLDPNIKPKEWPDFMDKDDTKKVHPSHKILGELFRIVQPDPHFSPTDIKSMGYPVDPRITRFQLHDTIIAKLKPVKAHYEKQLQYNMRRYRVFEVEIPSGIAIKNKRRKRARDQNLNEPLRDAYQILVTEARTMAMEVISSTKLKTLLTPPQFVARHCYALTFERQYVEEWEQLARGGTYGDNELEEGEYDLRSRPMTSFAWCFWQELVQIAALRDGPGVEQ